MKKKNEDEEEEEEEGEGGESENTFAVWQFFCAWSNK